MKDALREATDHFFGYFRSIHRFLSDMDERLGRENIVAEYGYDFVPNRRLLQACAHIEAVGRVVSDKPDDSAYTFRRVLQGWSGRPEWRLVTIPELWRAAHDCSNVRDQRLSKRLSRLLPYLGAASPSLAPRARPPLIEFGGIVLSSQNDIDVGTTLTALGSVGTEYDDVRCTLELFTLAAFLYREYRSGLVHEARRRAMGWHFTDNQTPHYHGQLRLRTSDFQDEDVDSFTDVDACLVIPDQFVMESWKGCIDSIEAHCRDEGINPFDRVG